MTSVTVGLDTAKSIFHVVEKNASGRILKKVKLPRNKLVNYFANKEACTIAIEACGACHYWSRAFSQLGHRVMIIAPQYVAQHRIGNKNDLGVDLLERQEIFLNQSVRGSENAKEASLW